MNRPLPTIDPATVPFLSPCISAAGHDQWDPVTFAAYILPRTNRLNAVTDVPRGYVWNGLIFVPKRQRKAACPPPPSLSAPVPSS